MAKPDKRAIVRAILRRYPKSHADRLRIDVTKDTPAPLYQWLLAALLFSARISGEQAHAAARALFDQGWRTPAKMAATSWEERVKVLNRAGYARYDESTSRYIGSTTDLLLTRYRGDLRRLRAYAECDPEKERERLKDFKGIGDVGVDIFLREVQLPWTELYPFADRRTLDVARKLGLDGGADGLARLLERKRDMPRLLSGLVYASGAKETEAILREAELGV